MFLLSLLVVKCNMIIRRMLVLRVFVVVSAVERMPTPSDPEYSKAEHCLVFLLHPLTLDAISDNAPLLFREFSWPIFLEVGGQVLLPSLS